ARSYSLFQLFNLDFLDHLNLVFHFLPPFLFLRITDKRNRPLASRRNHSVRNYLGRMSHLISEAHPSTPVFSPSTARYTPPLPVAQGQGDADSFTGAHLIGQWTRCRRCLRFLDCSYCSAAGYCFPDYPVCPVQSAPPILRLGVQH